MAWFALQDEPPYKFEQENPFASEEDSAEIASVGYRYRKWDLDNGIILVCRCELDGVLRTPNGENQFLTIKALNEWDSKVILFSRCNFWYTKTDVTSFESDLFLPLEFNFEA